MSSRPLQILRRFPAHLEPARPDKQLYSVVEALAGDLDVLGADLAAVRRAHRLKDADTLRDLLLLAGLHGLDTGMMEVFLARAGRVRALAKYLAQAVAANDTANRDLSAGHLFALWHTGSAPGGDPQLALYAPPHAVGTQPDLNAAALALAKAAEDSVSSRALLEATRAKLGEICRIHAHGNATVQAVLEATVNALDMDVDVEANAAAMAALVKKPNDQVDLTRTDGYFHSTDRYVHLTYARDRLQPAPRELPPASPGAPPQEVPLPYQPEVLGLQENPGDPGIAGGTSGPGVIGPVTDKELFPVMRRGFQVEKLKIRIKGMNGLTRNLQLVHRDEGKGLCFFAQVPDGKTLTIDEEGNFTGDFTVSGGALIDFAFTWEGGCFGDAADPSVRDWCFGGPGLPPEAKVARFATTTPPNMLDAGAHFPHAAGVKLSGVKISLGLNRFAFFVNPSPVVADQPVADITLTWPEHQPYVLTLWIPGRFFWSPSYPPNQTPDEPVAVKLVRALERFRPMGIHVLVAPNDSTANLAQINAMLTPAP
jgi:hypothetical protein